MPPVMRKNILTGVSAKELIKQIKQKMGLYLRNREKQPTIRESIKEEIYINKTLSLTAADAHITIKSDNNCFHIENAKVHLNNFTIESSADTSIYANNAELILEDCTVTGSIRIIQGKVLIRDCFLSDAKKDAIFTGHSTGRIENCDIFQMNGTGIFFVDSKINLLKSNIFNCENQGIVVSQSSIINIENCHVYNNKQEGINIDGSSKADIKNSDIHSNCCFGIHYRSSSNAPKNSHLNCPWSNDSYKFDDTRNAGSLENCRIFSNKGPGIYVETTRPLLIKNCHLDNNEGKDIFLIEENRVTKELPETREKLIKQLPKKEILKPKKMKQKETNIENNWKYASDKLIEKIGFSASFTVSMGLIYFLYDSGLIDKNATAGYITIFISGLMFTVSLGGLIVSYTKNFRLAGIILFFLGILLFLLIIIFPFPYSIPVGLFALNLFIGGLISLTQNQKQ